MQPESEVIDHKPKVGRFRRGWLLIKSSWRVIMLDKELLTLPIIGMFASLGVLIVAALLYILTLALHWGTLNVTNTNGTTEASAQWGWTGAVIIGFLTIGITFVSNFIAVAIAKGALDRFQGHDPTVRSSLKAAKSRAGSIFKFSLLALTVGLILQFIQDRFPFAGRLISWLGQMIWGVATFFVIPIIAMSDKPVGPIEATQQSTGVIKKVWGESLIINLGIGLIAILSTFIYGMLSAGLTVLGGSVYMPLGWVLGALALIGFFALILLFSVLSAIVRAAIYYWATTGKAPATFDKELLRASLTPKKARKVFALR